MTPAAGRATTPPAGEGPAPGPGLRVRYLQAGGKGRRGKHKGIPFAVASSFAIPLGTGSVHLLTDVFSPLAQAEFARVVEARGFFLYAVPGRGTCTA